MARGTKTKRQRKREISEESIIRKFKLFPSGYFQSLREVI